MSETVTRKKILILSDNEGVAKIVGLILEENYDVSAIAIDPPSQPETPIAPTDVDLIVMAISVYANEPVVVLARASLGCLIGQVPLLIISDHQFQSSADTQIAHMEFPFASDQLIAQVNAILCGNFLYLHPPHRYENAYSPQKGDLQ